MSSATQSSLTTFARSEAEEPHPNLSCPSSPVFGPASPASLQIKATDPILSAESTGAATGDDIESDAQSSDDGQSELKPIPAADNVGDFDFEGALKAKTLERVRAVTPSPSTPDPSSSGTESNELASASNKENASPKSGGSPRLGLILKRPSEKAAPTTPRNKPISTPTDSGGPSTSSGTSGSGLKLKLRCIQSALRDYSPPSELSFPSPTNGVKRSAALAFARDVDDTDSEFDIMPKRIREPTVTRATKRINRIEDQSASSASSRPSKRAKKADEAVAIKVEDDAMFDAGDEADSATEEVGPGFSLLTPALKRNMRILDPSYPIHAQLIATASKIGPEYYDSDVEVPGKAKDTGKPHLFRNVKWGSYATDTGNDADFLKEPEFTQFIPGRFELLPDGTVADQKAKLVIKLLDKSGRKRIFTNPPPRDWNNQEAITALNKRTVQQIRRNTNVRFREVVRAYVPEERRWILANLTAGKPTQGWKVFVDEFNKRFEGKVVAGASGTRPYRSHSSLTKEVERFGPQFYMKGLVPAPARKGKDD